MSKSSMRGSRAYLRSSPTSKRSFSSTLKSARVRFVITSSAWLIVRKMTSVSITMVAQTHETHFFNSSTFPGSTSTLSEQSYKWFSQLAHQTLHKWNHAVQTLLLESYIFCILSVKYQLFFDLVCQAVSQTTLFKRSAPLNPLRPRQKTSCFASSWALACNIVVAGCAEN